ncbi:MAG: UbiD family decarboxylase [Deltaproteobacteria bacterium]|nr:UbiD family decarboxylase [Deltaproteobacteria bacterium]
MRYRTLTDCITDLEQHGHLVRIANPVHPDLEMAEIHRRVFASGGPAIFYERVVGSPFPAVSNLFGTMDRARFIFRKTLPSIQRLMEIQTDPSKILSSPHRYAGALKTAWQMLPKKVGAGAVLAKTTSIDRLPAIRCWPEDGGAFILLPQVCTEDPDRPHIMHTNIGMYRIQLTGGEYVKNREIGLHYQIRRDIEAHHAAAIEGKQPLRVSIFVGGPPAHTLAAIMPLPEGMPEAAFAGGLAGRRFRYTRHAGHIVSADADFCITGTIVPYETKPEGQFGDHLGYYSLKHPFPFIKVKNVFHRPGAVWPFTVVGRPPQEDSVFGKLIHEITAPMVPKAIPGLCAVNAVDAAGVHPLLLAQGHERFVPYEKRKPAELLKISNAILGFGAMSLAKYLFLAAYEDNPGLDVEDIPRFFAHILARADWKRDLHFRTRTTIDTLDYSGQKLNSGSKVVCAVAGPQIRRLAENPPEAINLPPGFSGPSMAMPGVMIMGAAPFSSHEAIRLEMEKISPYLAPLCSGNKQIPLVVLADDPEFTANSLDNFLWVTFTRSDPAADIHGINGRTINKHWGCEGPLVIDARLKPWHTPVLEADKTITARVDEMAKKGGCLHGII